MKTADSKTCPRCRLDLPLEEFSMRSGERGKRRGPAARRAHCRECVKASRAAEVPSEPPASKQCRCCGAVKAACEFRKRLTRTGDSLTSRCRVCLRISERKAYREKNPLPTPRFVIEPPRSQPQPQPQPQPPASPQPQPQPQQVADFVDPFAPGGEFY